MRSFARFAVLISACLASAPAGAQDAGLAAPDTEALAASLERNAGELTGILRQLNIQEWAEEMKERIQQTAMAALGDIAVPEERKRPLRELALSLIQRES